MYLCETYQNIKRGTKIKFNKLHRLTERDSRLAHFSAHEIPRLSRLVIEIPFWAILEFWVFGGI